MRTQQRAQIEPDRHGMHHVRLHGSSDDIERFMSELRAGRFGGEVTQFQRYGAQEAAANIRATGVLDLSKLIDAARHNSLDAKIQFIQLGDSSDVS